MYGIHDEKYFREIAQDDRLMRLMHNIYPAILTPECVEHWLENVYDIVDDASYALNEVNLEAGTRKELEDIIESTNSRVYEVMNHLSLLENRGYED